VTTSLIARPKPTELFEREKLVGFLPHVRRTIARTRRYWKAA
jgi:hypothetical protein